MGSLPIHDEDSVSSKHQRLSFSSCFETSHSPIPHYPASNSKSSVAGFEGVNTPRDISGICDSIWPERSQVIVGDWGDETEEDSFGESPGNSPIPSIITSVSVSSPDGAQEAGVQAVKTALSQVTTKDRGETDLFASPQPIHDQTNI